MKNLILSFLIWIIACGSLLSQGFYDMNTINTIEITFQESNWDALLDQLVANGEEERLMGSVTINGQVFDSVGVRYKGNSSYNANQVKNPLNIKLDYIIDDQKLEGYGTIKLANGTKDPSQVREVLSYEIARKYMPASQSNYCNVYINGTHLGLYSNDQDVDKFFMRTNFYSDENARIKGEITGNTMPGQMGGVWQYFGTDSSDYFSKYALESDFGWTELVNFLDTINNHNEDADQVLNIDRHLWFLAFQNLLVNLDGPINNPQNYYLYQDDAGRFNPIPWDLNESFGVFTTLQTAGGGGGPGGGSGSLNTQQLQQLDPFVNIDESDYPVIGKILTNDTYRKIYIAHMKTMLEENFTNGWYESRALEIQEIIAEDVQADANKFYTYSDFTNNVYSSVGSGPNGIVGITELMDARADYLSSLTDFQYSAPEISNTNYSPEQVAANSEVWFTAEANDATEVKLCYRSSISEAFTKIDMYDDGAHQDGAAGDGVYGTSIVVGSTDMQYYFYAENNDAAAFMPIRAEYEFYEISISGTLVINEFMADNESTITDPAGDYDDWIELYNNGNEAIDLNGYYLSDDASEPDQWIFPDTSIAAGGYLIIWADKDEDQEGLHANFKLSTSGESILLSDANMNILNEINFGEQKVDTTTGRYPNGSGDFAFMLPTFERANEELITAINDFETIDINEIIAYPNPFSNQLSVSFSLAKASEVSITLSNTLGQQITIIENRSYDAGKHLVNFETLNLSADLWICTISNEATAKRIKLVKIGN